MTRRSLFSSLAGLVGLKLAPAAPVAEPSTWIHIAPKPLSIQIGGAYGKASSDLTNVIATRTFALDSKSSSDWDWQGWNEVMNDHAQP